MEAQPLMQNTYNHFPKHKAIPFSCFFYPNNSKKEKRKKEKQAGKLLSVLLENDQLLHFLMQRSLKKAVRPLFSLCRLSSCDFYHPNIKCHTGTLYLLSVSICISFTYRNEKCFLTLCLHLSTTPYAPTGTERRTHTINKEIHGDTFHYLNYGAAS